MCDKLVTVPVVLFISKWGRPHLSLSFTAAYIGLSIPPVSILLTVRVRVRPSHISRYSCGNNKLGEYTGIPTDTMLN